MAATQFLGSNTISDQCTILVSLSSVSTFSSVASGREIVPIREVVVTLYDTTSISGSNDPASAIIVEPSDHEGPTSEMSERAFNMYSP